MLKQQGIRPALHIPSYQQKLFPFQTFVLKSLRSPEQRSPRCSETLLFFTSTSFSSEPHLWISTSCFAVCAAKHPSHSQKAEAAFTFLLGRALEQSITSWHYPSAEGQGQCSPARQTQQPPLAKWENQDSFPMSLPHCMPGPWWRHVSHKCSCEQESNFLCSQVWHGYKWISPLNYTSSITQLHSAMDSPKQSQSFP